jgi:ABC-2 type transport system ATP-binding protein
MSEALLSIQNLSVRRGELQVLSDLSLQVHSGEIFGLLGPNGSGKSTTFSVITGLLEAQKGTFLLRGKAIKPGDKQLMKELGVVFQNPSLDLSLSAKENLTLAANLYRIPKAEQADRIHQLLKMADLSDRADEKVSTYSGGMKRRLDLARALIHKPKILLMDEPTTGLDEGAFQKTWRRLLQLRTDEGLSIILSTHRPQEAAFCDRIAFINHGTLLVCDTPSALQSQVSDDRIFVSCNNVEQAAECLKEHLKTNVKIQEQGVMLTCQAGHSMIPRVVEALPEGMISAIQMTRPHLGDVFLHLTGESLSEDKL